jgi:hypothetical protein
MDAEGGTANDLAAEPEIEQDLGDAGHKRDDAGCGAGRRMHDT